MILGKHLTVIEADLADFAGKHDYTVYPPLSGGRYPNRRISKIGSVIRSIHISMDDAPNGERFDQFFPDIPYSIFGMAWIDDLDQKKRWHAPSLGIEGVPFSALTHALPLHLAHFHGYLSAISADYIKACARISYPAERLRLVSGAGL